MRHSEAKNERRALCKEAPQPGGPRIFLRRETASRPGAGAGIAGAQTAAGMLRHQPPGRSLAAHGGLLSAMFDPRKARMRSPTISGCEHYRVSEIAAASQSPARDPRLDTLGQSPHRSSQQRRCIERNPACPLNPRSRFAARDFSIDSHCAPCFRFRSARPPDQAGLNGPTSVQDEKASRRLIVRCEDDDDPCPPCNHARYPVARRRNAPVRTLCVTPKL